MIRARGGVCFRLGSVSRGLIALLLLAAIGLGVLPVSVERPVVAGAETSCRFEPVDVCGAGDPSLGVLADLPTLPPAALAVLATPTVLPAPPDEPAFLAEGFAPGVYRPPRPSC